LIEIRNPSELFLGERDKKIPGSVITASIEGTRPILIEVQALVTPSNFGNPQRVTAGLDYRRLSILLAVLEKRADYRLSNANVFLNIAGGMRIFEPAIDLAVCCAVASSLVDKVIDENAVIIGEVGLGGEIRNVGNIEKRIQEAEKFGLKRAFIPKRNQKELKSSNSIQIIPVESLNETIHLIIK
jgi:DNA repair protein RadA/Sms